MFFRQGKSEKMNIYQLFVFSGVLSISNLIRKVSFFFFVKFSIGYILNLTKNKIMKKACAHYRKVIMALSLGLSICFHVIS